jgi:hypothetical protein
LTLRDSIGRWAALGCVAGVALVACSSSSGKGNFTLDFPSTAAAVATDAVQVYAFDGSDPSACTTLVVQTRSQQTLPAVINETSPASPCALASGGGSLELNAGTYALLAIGVHQGKNFVIGCGLGGVNSAGGSVTIEMTLFDNTVSVPATSCQRLSQHCSGSC